MTAAPTTKESIMLSFSFPEHEPRETDPTATSFTSPAPA